ncbi:hypothetical protein [Rhodococcus sp. NPDC058521]|uniref:hypothetical protein n=1 Tax=Rhodococcus sp. NPDC058521 TaxID=3346536 RepID=UPI0036579757
MGIQVTPRAADAHTIEAVFSVDGKDFTVRTTATASLDTSGTPWLPPGVVVAGTTGKRLELDRPVDPVALSGGAKAGELLRSWYPQMSQADVHAEESAAEVPDDRGVGCFFSGGLDAFYTALKNREEITHLILVHGFDIDPRRQRPYDRISSNAKKVAAELGVELIEVRTNLQFLHVKYGHNWASAAHGAALAHVGLLLSQHLRKVIIASSFEEGRRDPHGSHPDLDPLWSSGGVELVQDGLESNRVAKAAAVKDNDLVARYLRVCNLNTDDEYNCGKCEKCIRTMVNLYVVGGLERSESLPLSIPIERMKTMHVRPGGFRFVQENLDEMRARGVDDPELEAALVGILVRSPRRQQFLKYRWLLLEIAPKLPGALFRIFEHWVKSR